LRFRHALLDVLPFFIIAAGTMILTWLLTHWISNNILLLISRVIIAAGIYFIILKIVHAAILEECIAFLRKKVGK